MSAGKTTGAVFGRQLKVICSFAFIIGILGEVLLAVSLATDHWLDTTISKASLLVSPLAYNHYQGLFRTCYTGGEITEITRQFPYLMEDRYLPSADACVRELGLGVFQTESRYSGNFVARAHFLRAIIGGLGSASCCVLLASLLMVCGMCRRSGGHVTAAAVFYLLACLFGLTAILFFVFGVRAYQDEKLTTYMFYYAGWKLSPMFSTYQSSITIAYGWSFLSAAVGSGLALVACILTFIAVGIQQKDIFGETDENEYYNTGCNATIQKQPKPPAPDPQSERTEVERRETLAETYVNDPGEMYVNV